MGLRRSTFVSVGVFLFACIWLRGGVFAEESSAAATRIIADYRVDLAVFNVGTLRFTTLLTGSDYEVRGEGHFSMLGGLLYDWRATTKSSGKVTSSGPEPTMYALSYGGGGESGQLRMSFDGGAVTQLSMAPKKNPTPQEIPITKEQLAGVLDPMSAAFLLAHSENSDGDLKVCDQSIPVFDGEWRFDLVLTPKRKVRVQKEASTGYSGYAVVCRVRFKPISGYRPDDPNIKIMSHSDAIEIWLVSLPGTAMYVPYRFVLPTEVGSVSATSTSFHVDGDRRAK
jgi:hypothetical protein